MQSDLQRLVESLGARLHRSVALDDSKMNLLAYSPHDNEVDPARTASILKRSMPREVVDFVYGRGAGTARDLFAVPARPDLGMDIARVAMPVYHHESLLGFIWLLASDGPVTDEHREAISEAARAAAMIMHREYLLGTLSRDRAVELSRDLLADQIAVRRRAADQLIAENLFASDPALAMVVLLQRDGPLTDEDRLALDAGTAFGRKQRDQRRALTVERPDHAVLILTPGADDPRTLSALGLAVRNQVLTETADGATCRVGIGSAVRALTDVMESYSEAMRAAQIAMNVGVLGDVVQYSELGVYGLLAELPAGRLADLMHPKVRELACSGRSGDVPLVQTIEAFLDNAGDVKQTSDQLLIHRTSLYYRLKRIEELTGLNLSVGEDRLLLHLSLKIARLIHAR